jgi:hypothetical protein
MNCGLEADPRYRGYLCVHLVPFFGSTLDRINRARVGSYLLTR